MKKWCGPFLLPVLILMLLFDLQLRAADNGGLENRPYPCMETLIEVMFSPESAVRLRDGKPVDLSAVKALSGVDDILEKVTPYSWRRLCDISEEKLDEIQSNGTAKSGNTVYNLNNIYRLRIPDGHDIWALCQELEALPGIMNARPMPLPTPPPFLPPNYETAQGYLQPASMTPTGIDAYYAWGAIGGAGAGITVCDIEYSWNYNHADILKAIGSQINPAPLVDPFPAGRAFHGTAVIGALVADDNAWGTTGICKDALLKTCGSNFTVVVDPPYTAWDVPAAITIAIANLAAGDVILLEQQWDYNDTNTVNQADFIPIEWWTDFAPNWQTFNGVYAAIQNAISNGIYVVEAGGNGSYNTDNLTWFGNSGAIVVGGGGVYAGGTWVEGDLQRASYSSFGTRFNLQGWGENVVTTGYGDLDSTMGYNYMYTATFGGTSSSSAVVAAAVACCSGYWQLQGLNPLSLTPTMLRDILVTTGTAQVTPPAGQIGPRPNLQAALAALTVEWTNVTSPPIDDSAMSAMSAAWGDYDNDGFLDLYLTNSGGNTNRLCRNTGAGFSDASASPVNDPNFGNCSVWGDYDNDGDLDLYLANNGGPNRLFRNMGAGVFSDATWPPLDEPGVSVHANWVDYDNDGDIDLYVTNHMSPNRLFRNDGGGAWTDIIGSPINYLGSSAGSSWGDYDNDGDMDLYLACYNGEANHLYRNDGGGVFVDVTVAPLNDTGEGMGSDWGDYDNDGDLDLYLVNYGGTSNKFFENKSGVYADATLPPLDNTGNWGWSAGWADYDNDGDLDLYFTNSYAQNRLLRNDGPYTFTDRTTPIIADSQAYSVSFSWGDYDSDGDLDLYVVNTGLWPSCHLYRNEIGDDNNWFKLDLIGTVSNRNGIGARIRLVVGGVSQIREVTSGSGYTSVHSLTAEFGVGSATIIDSLIVRWPSGTVQTLTAVNVNNHIQLTEPAGAVVCGDANGDAQVNVGDAVFVIAYVFKGGPAPNPVCSGDANGDGQVNVGDAVYLIAYVFKGGPAPVPGCCP